MLVHAQPFNFFTAAQIGRLYTTANNNVAGALVGTATPGAFGPLGGPGLRFAGDRADSLDLRSSSIPSGAIYIAQADFSNDSNFATNVILAAMDGSSMQCSLNFDNGVFRVYRGFTASLLGTVPYTYTLGTTITICWKVVIDNSAGSIEVRIYEADDPATPAATLTLGPIDTQATGNASWNGAHLGAASNGNTDWANYVVMDGSGSDLNDILGPVDVFALWASDRAAGALADWTLSAGSDIPALVDDATPDDDSTYLTDSTNGHLESVFVDKVPFPTRAILGAELYLGSKKGSGSPTLQPLARQTGTNVLGTSQAPGASYGYAVQPHSTMPDGSPFTGAEAFDLLEWGAKQTSSDPIRLTQIVVAVIQTRDADSSRNLITGYQHAVTGDDNLIVGQSNAVIGAMSQAHGITGEVVGNRSVLFSLDGSPHVLTGDGKFAVFADSIELHGTVTGGSSGVAGPGSSTDNAIARFDGAGGSTLQNSTPTVEDDGRIANVTDPTGAQDAATKAYVDGIAVNLGSRATVRAATTANITIATALNNGDSLDGVTLATGNLVLVKDQSSAAENGVYVVGASPSRASQFDTYNEHPGALIAVQEGTANADTLWLCTSNAGGTLNSTAIAYSSISVSAGITQLTSDVTAGPGSGSQAATIANDAVTYAKMQNVSAASKLLGRGSAAGSGDPQEITLGTGLSMSGTTLNTSGASPGSVTFVRKTADESVASSAALQDDDHLNFAVGTGETWFVQFWLLGDATTAGDIQVAINVPTGTTGWWGGLRFGSGAASANDAGANWSYTTTLDDTGTRNIGGAGAGNVFATPVQAFLITTTSGTVKLRWAQLASNGTASKILTNSFLLATRLA